MQEGGKVNMKTSIQQSAILSINAGFAFERKETLCLEFAAFLFEILEKLGP